MLQNYKETKLDEEEVTRRFNAYCRKTLRNAKKDIYKKDAYFRKWEQNFCDMSQKELLQLKAPKLYVPAELFIIGNRIIGIEDETLAFALKQLTPKQQCIVLLYYFAGWTDSQISIELHQSRSTIQRLRRNTLLQLKNIIEKGQQ